MIAEEVVKLLNKSEPLDGDTPMSAKETAAYLKMSMSHFSHIAIRLPRVKSGRKWLYPKKQINNLLIHGIKFKFIKYEEYRYNN